MLKFQTNYDHTPMHDVCSTRLNVSTTNSHARMAFVIPYLSRLKISMFDMKVIANLILCWTIQSFIKLLIIKNKNYYFFKWRNIWKIDLIIMLQSLDDAVKMHQNIVYFATFQHRKCYFIHRRMSWNKVDNRDEKIEFFDLSNSCICAKTIVLIFNFLAVDKTKKIFLTFCVWIKHASTQCLVFKFLPYVRFYKKTHIKIVSARYGIRKASYDYSLSFQ